MTADQIEQILHGAERPAPAQPHEKDTSTKQRSSTGIGLENVIKRLRLFYNRDDLLTIHSEGHMRGTEVTVILPPEQDAGWGKERGDEEHVSDTDRG